jgi:hypothetical protein
MRNCHLTLSHGKFGKLRTALSVNLNYFRNFNGTWEVLMLMLKQVQHDFVQHDFVQHDFVQ